MDAGNETVTYGTYDFQLFVAGLEMALAHDGVFRGRAEPVLILAVYARTAARVQTIGRSLHRFHPEDRLPCTVPADLGSALKVRLRHTPLADLVLLAIAMEQDNGMDIRRMYGAVEDARTLSVWVGSRPEVQPLQLSELPCGSAEWSCPVPVELQVEGLDASRSCGRDKWIGASAWALPPGALPGGGAFRARFLSPDRRNDWTALLNVWSEGTLEG